jgi:uncharacterized membrane protein YcaP (DUF421 family)
MPGIDFSQLLVPSISIFGIILRTFVVYLVVVLGLRFFGKRELGQMTPFDLVLVLTLSNSVQNAMTGPDTSLTGGLVSAATLLFTNWAINQAGRRVPKVRELLVGSPALLIHDGKMIPNHMVREGIDADELLQAAREHGINSLDEVQEAVLEVDGTISIIPSSAPAYKSKRKHYRKMP